MLEVKRKDNESFESLIRRFTKKTVQSGRILQAKKIQFRQPPLNYRARKQKALRREEIKGLREYLQKVGKLEEYDKNNKKSKKRR